MKLFQSGRLPAERQGAVVEMICNRGNEHDLKVVFERVVQPDGFPPDLRLKAMGWLADAAMTRKLRPAGKLAALEELVAGKSATQPLALQKAAIRLASTWKVVAISPALQALATDSKGNAELQRVAIDGLIAIGDPASRETLRQLVARRYPMPVRMQAVGGLAGLDLTLATSAAAAVFGDATSQDDPAAMLDAFLNRKLGADQLAAALAQQSFPVDVAKRALRYMYSVGRSDAALSDVLSQAAGLAADAAPPTPAEVAQIVNEVTTKGDAEHGERIFRRKDLNCIKCHSISRAGGQVGPDLSAVGGSSPVEYVVNSILNPNLAIKEQFVTRVFVLATGKVLTGIVIDRDEVRVNIRDASGQPVTIPTADIEEELEGKSLMPQGLTKFLTRAELLDLARFVSELGKPGRYAVQQAKTIQRWRVLRNAPTELTADLPHLEHFRQFVVGSQPADWDSAYAQVAGVLPLDELRVDSKPTVVILQGELHVSAAGSISIEMTCTENVQTWVDTEAFESQRQFAVDLSPGRHTVTVRVEISNRESPTLRVELKTPSDSAGNFEVIAGA